MDKNENGIPRPESPGGIVGGVTDDMENGCTGGCQNGCNGGMNHSCGGTGNCLDSMPLAYVYAPNQHFRMLYSANEALKHGTLFEELYKPMEVYGRE